MSYQRGDVVLVPFPFTDLSRRKTRPAIVISSDRMNRTADDVILVALSSRVATVPGEFDAVIAMDSQEFRATGLRVSSVVKANKLVTIEQSLIYASLGKLSPSMLQAVTRRVLRAVGAGK